MHLRIGEAQAARGLVGHDLLFHLRDDQTFAGGTALMHARIRIRKELIIVLEDADLGRTQKYDSTIAVPEIAAAADLLLLHLTLILRSTKPLCPAARP